VLQGEGGTVQSLLARTASLTNSIADRDQLVGQVIDNLSGTLQTVDAHHQQLTELLVQMRGLMGRLAQDRTAIGTSLTNVSALTAQVARLVTDARPWAKQDIAELRRVMQILNRPANQALMSDTLARLPKTLAAQARIGTFGSWYNYYLCDFTATIILPKLGDLLGLPPAVAKPLDQALDKIQGQINQYTNVYSTAKRCDG
jgi:phospholipid/cholesterol/gamma-HCH transport system substrate-binding protein